MHAPLPMPPLKAVGSWLVLALGLLVGEASAQWNIAMRAMRNPLPLGECTYVEIVISDAEGRQGPPRPDGKQVSGWDFDFTVTSSAPNAFRLQNDDATRPFVCARAPTAPSATFTAHYPGRQLKPNQVVPGVELRQSIEVAMAGVPVASPQVASAPAAQPNPAAAAAGAAYPNPGSPGGNAPSGGYPQQDPASPSGAGAAGAYPGAGYPQGSTGYPSGSGSTAGYPSPGYPSGSPSSGGYAPGGYPQDDPAQASGYPQGSGYPQPSGPTQPSGDPQAGATQPGQSTVGMTVPDSGVRTGKQFLQRIAGHAKRKAGEVASSTSTQVADGAGDVVGTTLEAGSNVVKSGTGAVTGAASAGVQGVGRSLGAAPSPKDPADVAAALAAGRAVFHGLRFTEGTAMLEPNSGPLISQIASALARAPGQFLIEAHVDGKKATAAQALSEQRAAAVKAALVAAGSSPMQLAAVGYGATRPFAGAKSSARIEIVRTQ